MRSLESAIRSPRDDELDRAACRAVTQVMDTQEKSAMTTLLNLRARSQQMLDRSQDDSCPERRRVGVFSYFLVRVGGL